MTTEQRIYAEIERRERFDAERRRKRRDQQRGCSEIRGRRTVKKTPRKEVVRSMAVASA
ncbi:MAG TPA: hypothetical protein VMB05_14605 [Solirubrobacteraceae bacterium]|nr:hypothetical protein [Solirubrobacteraceae bacterium]